MNKYSSTEKDRMVPLSRSLLTWFVVIALVPLMIVGTFAYYFMAKGLLQSSAEQLLASSERNLVSIQSWVDQHRLELDLFAQTHTVKHLLLSDHLSSSSIFSAENLSLNTLSEMATSHPDVFKAVLIDSRGQRVTSKLESEESFGGETGYIIQTISQALEQKSLVFSDLYKFENSVMTGVIARPVFGEELNVIGAVAFLLNFESLKELITSEHTNYLLGEDNSLRSAVSGSNYEPLGKPVSLDSAPSDGWSVYDFYRYGASKAFNSVKVDRFFGVSDGLVVGTQKPINVFGEDWVLVSEEDYYSIVLPAENAALVTSWLMFALMFVVIVAALWKSRQITRPIESLTELSEAVIRGDISHRAELKAQNEIGVLAQHINLMLDVRQKNENIIQRSYAESEEALLALNQQKYALDQHSIVEITDLKGVITFVNSKCEEITGYKSNELVGRGYSSLASGEHTPEFWEAIYQTIGNGGVWRGEICNKSKNGGLFWVDTTIAPFMRDGKPESFIVIRNDISLAKLTELELIEAKNAAEDGTKAKSDFLASMSHEIRTPMNGVLGMLNLLMKTKLDDVQRRQAQLAYGSAESLLTIINDILDFSKIEAGKLELEMMDFDLRSLFSEFAASIAPRIYEKDLEFILDLKGIDRDKVKGDPGRLRQVLINLVGNAIKFTESGEITVQASVLESYNQRLKLECVIKDTGIGIPKEKQSKLFESFSQVDASTTRKYGGTGLGLTIVSQLCELMGGQIFVESEIGQGSSFTFSIYFEAADDARWLADEGEALIGQRVLVIDDNRAFVENLCAQLDQWKVTATGVSTIDSWNELKGGVCDADQYYDIMLVKQCRDGESIELINEVMSCEGFRSVPKVALTQVSTMVSLDDLRAEDFSAGLTKPCAPDEVLRTLVYLVLGQSNSFSLDELVAEEAAPSKSIREKLIAIAEDTRVLLVEDNPVNQIVASSLLDQVGLSCDMAGNGKEAITALRRSQADALYDVVLMDCQMPELDGYEATRQIRHGLAGERYTDVVIIAMTANAMKGDREKCLEAGMNDYISKPINSDKLEETLAEWLLDKKPGSSNEVSNSDGDQSSMPTKGEDSMSNGTQDSSNNSGASEGEPIWDRQTALDNLAGCEEIYASLLEASLQDIPENIERLEQAISDTDLEMARISAHSVKGVAASVGAMLLMDEAKKAEMAAREHNIERVSSHLPSIRERFNQFKEVIEA